MCECRNLPAAERWGHRISRGLTDAQIAAAAAASVVCARAVVCVRTIFMCRNDSSRIIDDLLSEYQRVQMNMVCVCACVYVMVILPAHIANMMRHSLPEHLRIPVVLLAQLHHHTLEVSSLPSAALSAICDTRHNCWPQVYRGESRSREKYALYLADSVSQFLSRKKCSVCARGRVLARTCVCVYVYLCVCDVGLSG